MVRLHLIKSLNACVAGQALYEEECIIRIVQDVQQFNKKNLKVFSSAGSFHFQKLQGVRYYIIYYY